MDIKRIARHLLVTDGQVGRSFGRSTLNKIEAAIKASEAEHVGEIRFAVEGGLEGSPLFKGQSARERAIELFSQLRVWDTQHNTGVLIYLLLGDRAVEIVADRGHPRQGEFAGMEQALPPDGGCLQAVELRGWSGEWRAGRDAASVAALSF